MKLPLVPPTYNNADDKPHNGLYNLREASELTGYSVKALRDAIARHELMATKHIWRYGLWLRRAYFVNATELMRYVGWKASNGLIKRS